MASAAQREEPGAEDDHEGAQPIDDAACAETRPADLHGIDLRQVEPCDSAQAEAEGHDEDGEADDGHGPGHAVRHHAAVPGVRRDREEGHRHGLAEGADEEQRATAQVVHQAGAQQGRENIRRRHGGRGHGQARWGDAGLSKQAVRVGHQAVNAAELLEGCEAPAQEDRGPEERVPDRLGHLDPGDRTRHVHGHAQILQLQSDRRLLRVAYGHHGGRLHAIHAEEHLAGSVRLAALHQQGRRIRGEEQRQPHDLEDREDQRQAHKPSPIPGVQVGDGVGGVLRRRPLRNAKGDRGQDAQRDEDAMHRGVDASTLPGRDLGDEDGAGDRGDPEAQAGDEAAGDERRGAHGGGGDQGADGEEDRRQDELPAGA
mmetsp:Transcript_56705/g.164481  ORF Transcript_56705/g.164481 Transcript_56705/m.164481 type:complete len:371 (-) Transcript_56705:97-1209(-)